MENKYETPNGLPPQQTNGGEKHITSVKLSNPLKLVILMISLGTLFTLGMLLFGDIENNVGSVIVTLFAFATFTFFSIFDMSTKKSSDYMNASLGINIYLLLAAIYLIWFKVEFPTEYAWTDPLFDHTVSAIVLGFMARIALFFAEKVGRLRTNKHHLVSFCSKVTVGLIGLTLFLYSFPALAFDIHEYYSESYDTYWKVALASLILLALSFSVMSLLYAFYTKDERLAAKESKQESLRQHYAMQQAQAQSQVQQVYPPQAGYVQQNQPYSYQPQGYPNQNYQPQMLMMPDNVTPVPLLPNGTPNMEIYQHEVLRLAKLHNQNNPHN